jgi:glutamate-1-semialdehyde 2,1-aminomutase
MINRQHLKALHAREEERFLARTPKSRELFEKAKGVMPGGVPMSWMAKWPGKYPLFVASAQGAHFVDVDGNEFIDLCLGDTGSMTGHSPQLPLWQFTVSATDANRHAIRYSRLITGKQKIVVIDRCYHGSVDETFATLDSTGATVAREGNIGAPVPLDVTTRVVEFNDLAAMEAALKAGDVAAILMEPAMTNVGIVLPDEGYLAAVGELAKKYGVIWIIDETHTISVGPGGMTAQLALKPDFLTIGKAIGGGIPTGTFGMTHEIADQIAKKTEREVIDTGGIGGTLAGNALSLAAMRATLTEVLTEANFVTMIALGNRWCDGVEAAIIEFRLPWHVNRLGARGEYLFQGQAPRTGGEAARAGDFELDQYIHLRLLNDGFLLTPFHNMALVSPCTSESDIDAHTQAFRAMCKELVS